MNLNPPRPMGEERKEEELRYKIEIGGNIEKKSKITQSNEARSKL